MKIPLPRKCALASCTVVFTPDAHHSFQEFCCRTHFRRKYYAVKISTKAIPYPSFNCPKCKVVTILKFRPTVHREIWRTWACICGHSPMNGN